MSTRRGLRRLTHPRSRHHLRRHRQPHVDRELATGRRGGSGALLTAQGLAAQYQWTFFFAQSFIPAVNGVLLGSLLYQSRLVPRWLPVLALIGAGLLVAAWFAVLVGLIKVISPVAAVLTLPIAAWELSLGIYLTFWGFKPSPITAGL